MKLDEPTRLLTTLETPIGRYRWLRLPFGIAPPPDILQRRLDQALERLKGVYNIADDILITGEGPTMDAAREDHDRNLLELIKKCQATGIRLNKDNLRLPVWLTAGNFSNVRQR